MPRSLRNTILVAGLLACLLSGCLGTPPNVTVVDNFDLDRYLGTWHEVARLDHRFERGLNQVTATYELREDGGVRVINRGFREDKGTWDSAEGKAYFVSSPEVGALKVSFFGPFYGAYNVVALDPDYRWAMVVGPSTSMLWILSREPDLDRCIMDALIGQAEAAGFPVEELILMNDAAPCS